MKRLTIAVRMIVPRYFYKDTLFSKLETKYLVLKKPNGAFTFPGGKYESSKDATYKDTGIRELLEETGLIVLPHNRKSIKYRYTSIHPKHCTYFFEVPFGALKGNMRINHREGKPCFIRANKLIYDNPKSKFIGDFEILRDLGVI